MLDAHCHLELVAMVLMMYSILAVSWVVYYFVAVEVLDSMYYLLNEAELKMHMKAMLVSLMNWLELVELWLFVKQAFALVSI